VARVGLDGDPQTQRRVFRGKCVGGGVSEWWVCLASFSSDMSVCHLVVATLEEINRPSNVVEVAPLNEEKNGQKGRSKTGSKNLEFQGSRNEGEKKRFGRGGGLRGLTRKEMEGDSHLCPKPNRGECPTCMVATEIPSSKEAQVLAAVCLRLNYKERIWGRRWLGVLGEWGGVGWGRAGKV